jgi:hypothetical protein
MAEGPPRSPLYAHSAKKNFNLGCFEAVYKVSLNPGYFEVGCYSRLTGGGYTEMLFSRRLKIELDLQSLFGLLCTAVLVGRNNAILPRPPHLGSFTKALLVTAWSAKIDDISL